MASREDALPTFLLIGAMKAGTTSLWQYLRSHPDVYMPAEKEPDFFVEEKRWGLGLNWYRSLFAGSASASARGEASTNYSKYPLFTGVPERIATVLPDVRIVYIVRHPIERMHAHYLHARAEGWERRPIGRALLDEAQYLDVSRYASQLDRYLRLFDASRILVVTAEALRDDRKEIVRRVLSFVGANAEAMPSSLDREMHGTAQKTIRRPAAALTERLPGWSVARRLAPERLRRAWGRRTRVAAETGRFPVPPDVERVLRDALEPEVRRLRDLVGPGFDGWGIA